MVSAIASAAGSRLQPRAYRRWEMRSGRGLAGALAAVVAAGIVIAVVVVVVVVETKSTPDRSTAQATVQTAHSKLGQILVNRDGHTLYLFESDKPDESACSAACARVWPPAIASGKVTAGHGVRAALLTTIARASGARQLVYNGHPLYTSVADTRRGDMNGEAFFGQWFAVSPRGTRVAKPGQKISVGYGK